MLCVKEITSVMERQYHVVILNLHFGIRQTWLSLPMDHLCQVCDFEQIS